MLLAMRTSSESDTMNDTLPAPGFPTLNSGEQNAKIIIFK